MYARLLAVALMAVAVPAFAAVDSTPIECPVDHTEVSVTVPLSTNSLLGHDRDLCPHASDAVSDEISSSVSACTTCGFAGTAAEFRGEVSASLAAKIGSSLKVATTPWERYANRAQIQEWEKSPEASIGESWLRAAWAVRLDERSSGDPVIAEATKRLLGDAPAAGDPLLDPARALDRAAAAATGADRASGLYAAGSLFRARGELAQAESRYAAALTAAAGTPVESSIKGVVDRDRASIALEKSYLGRALTHFQAALADKATPGAQRPLLAFLGGECARRTGANDDAAKLYRQAKAAKSADPQVLALADQGLADVAPAKTPKKKAK